jgi:hypothetical protein
MKKEHADRSPDHTQPHHACFLRSHLRWRDQAQPHARSRRPYGPYPEDKSSNGKSGLTSPMPWVPPNPSQHPSQPYPASVAPQLSAYFLANRRAYADIPTFHNSTSNQEIMRVQGKSVALSVRTRTWLPVIHTNMAASPDLGALTFIDGGTHLCSCTSKFISHIARAMVLLPLPSLHTAHETLSAHNSLVLPCGQF